MMLYQTSSGYTLKTSDNRVYDIIAGKGYYRFTSETFTINGRLLHAIPNPIKRLCFTLNRKPNASA